MKVRLNIELVPVPARGINCRTLLPHEAWYMLRTLVYRKFEYKCKICGSMSQLDAHEVWKYTKTTQKLVDLVALCSKCHSFKHFGYYCMTGGDTDVVKHAMTINKWTEQQVYSHYKEQLRRIDKFKECSFVVDLSYIIEFLLNYHGVKHERQQP